MERGKFFGFLWGVALALLLVGTAPAAQSLPDFSAVIVTHHSGREMLGKVYVKGDKARWEMATPMGQTTAIVRRDKQVMWMLMPGQKAYMEMPLSHEVFDNNLNVLKKSVTKKLLGTETINGEETEKYEVLANFGGQQIKSYAWISKKLGLPLRVETPDKSYVQEYKDIRLGEVDDGLFEIPAGFQKLAMPPGMPRPK